LRAGMTSDNFRSGTSIRHHDIRQATRETNNGIIPTNLRDVP
jgi:hypothetical protein